MTNVTQEIQKRLFELQDLKYRDFQCGLMPSVDSARVIGVRIPQLRKLAKEIASKGTVRTPAGEHEFDAAVTEFLSALPHQYYEEDNLHGLLIGELPKYCAVLAALDYFLPYVDNWATCDIINPKVFKKRPPEINKIMEWINSDRTYTIRFGIGMLMGYYLDERFSNDYLNIAAAVKSDEYYVNMMVAWYFATALAKQYDAAMKYLENGILPPWTHNKTIQKAIESYRITDSQKAYLRTLKR